MFPKNSPEVSCNRDIHGVLRTKDGKSVQAIKFHDYDGVWLTLLEPQILVDGKIVQIDQILSGVVRNARKWNFKKRDCFCMPAEWNPAKNNSYVDLLVPHPLVRPVSVVCDRTANTILLAKHFDLHGLKVKAAGQTILAPTIITPGNSEDGRKYQHKIGEVFTP